MEPAGIGVASVVRDASGQPILEFASQTDCLLATGCEGVLSEIVKSQSLHNSRCNIILSSNSYQLSQANIAELPEGERRDAARWQIGERIDYPPEEAVVDLYEVAPYGSEKIPLVYVVSAQQALLRDRIQLAEASGLALEAIDIPEFALRNVCDLFTEDERGLAILLLLEQSGVLVIVRDGTLYLVRWLNSGMNDLIPYAENIEALTEQLDTIVLEIQRSFDYCESTFHLPLVSRLLIAQTQQEIPAVVSYLNDYLTVPVTSFSFENVLTVPEENTQIELNRCLISIGGALRRRDH